MAKRHDGSAPPGSVLVGLFLLSAATLLFEINLTRLFSVTQFYHFAFLIVSLALLGFGASGSALVVFPRITRGPSPRRVGEYSLAAAVSIIGAYLVTILLPFDSFAIAWDSRQALILLLQILALTLPFFFSGIVTGLLITTHPAFSHSTYAVNLAGSAAGCAAALAAPVLLGGEGTVVLSSGLCAAAALACFIGDRHAPAPGDMGWPAFRRATAILLAALIAGLALQDASNRAGGKPTPPWFEIHLSPYKSLSYALQAPGARVIAQEWNSFSRVDLVQSDSIRSLPGLSYRYPQPPPPQDGLLVDGDDLSPVVRPGSRLDFAVYMPQAAGYLLRPGAKTLVLEPRGGLDVLIAWALGARQVTAVEANPLLFQAARHIYHLPNVETITDSDRSYLARAQEQFDLVIISLASSYHPVRSGAYSLAEDYRYTVEAFQSAFDRLHPNGLLVVTRWLQMPPSESLRVFATAVTALERAGGYPSTQIVAYRGYNTATLLVKKGAFTSAELAEIRAFAGDRAFDLIIAPGIGLEETNLYNVLEKPVYSEAYRALLEASPRESFYDTYAFDVRPPTDDRPFGNHYFRWSQTSQLLAEIGKTWQPFGGAGYFVVIILLLVAVVFAALLILLPVIVVNRRTTTHPAADRAAFSRGESRAGQADTAFYFGLVGLGYLLVEIPLIQRFILYLGHPAYSVTAVLFALLLFSGLGSRFSRQVEARLALPLLAIALLVYPWFLTWAFAETLGLSFTARLALSALIIAPIGLLMGIPFPAGVQIMEAQRSSPGRIAWAWAINGSASVIASVLAALLAISLGFSWVLRIGALCYAGAWLVVLLWRGRRALHSAAGERDEDHLAHVVSL